jgi:hypothetical protein
MLDAHATIVHVDRHAAASPDGVDVTLTYDAEIGAPPPALAIDGYAAVARGPARRASCAWHVVFDARVPEKERFREARQIALYFASDFAPEDVVEVAVVRAEGALQSGWHGAGEIDKLRAPLDATLDPPKHADATPVAELDAGPPPVVSARAVLVRIGAVEDGTRVTAFDGVDTIPLGQAQSAGPRLLARLRARAARTQVATWRAPCVGPKPHALTFDGLSTKERVDLDTGAWPLDVTRAYVEDGRVVAEGRFCWGDDAARAVATFAPGGQRVTAAFASGARASFDAPGAEFTQVTFQDVAIDRSATRSVSGGGAVSRKLWIAAAALIAIVAIAALARLRRA